DSLYRLFYFNCNRLKLGYRPRIPNLRNPKTFNEKILYLKSHYRVPDAHVIADKYAVRKYVSDRIGRDISLPLLGVFESAEAVDFSVLPQKFVLKPNHGSGM